MKTIAVIPAYNEAKRVRPVVEKTCKLVDKVVVVDDGSTDSTFQQIQNINPSVIPLKHKVNLGKGAALKTGCEAALRLNADIIVMLDSDGQHKPEKIPKFIEQFENKNIDVVFGSRTIGRDMPLAMMLGNKLLSITCSILFRIYVSDTQSGFRAFKSSIYPLIRWDSTDYSIETEVVVKTGKNKIKYSEIDIETIYENIYKGTTFIDGIKIFINMLIWRIT